MSLELGRVTDRKPPYKFSSLTRIGFSDTDAQGIVYYGRYLPYFDAARVEYHRHLDMLNTTDFETGLVMRASSIEYLAPARFDDLIEVFIRVARIGRTSVTYEMAAYLVETDELMVTSDQTLVLVDLGERKALPIPDVFRERIRAFEGDDLSLDRAAAARSSRPLSTPGAAGIPSPLSPCRSRGARVYPSSQLPRPFGG